MVPIVQLNDKTTMSEASTVAPALEPSPCRKIDMTGYIGLSAKARSRSLMQNKTTIIIAKPKVPFSITLPRSARGSTTGASWISSAICMAPSAPGLISTACG